MYVEIENNQIVKNHSSLPDSYRNISNFFALEAEKLIDLSWSGNSGVKFYPYIEYRPESMSENSVLIGPEYIIDHENHCVIGTFKTSPEPVITPVVPQTITARQIRMWLVLHGYSLKQVEEAIQAIEDLKQRELVSIEWEFAPYVERNHPMVISIASALGMTEEDIDQAFIEGSII